ncbi:MAG: hypothetical protein AAGH46_11185, partial [Bacteroidota bacterium]
QNLELLLAAAENDQVGLVEVSFGPKGNITLHTNYGHEVFWIKSTSPFPFNQENLLSMLRGYSPCTQKQLAWDYVL